MSPNTAFNLSPDLLSAVMKEQWETFNGQELGVRREMLKKVQQALDSPQILIITGLRRAGKSTLMAQIARTYLEDRCYFINFEDERLLQFTAEDFDLLHESLISLFGEKKVFLFDEIQAVPHWERFVRRLHDQGYKILLTGSNAALLSEELGTKLTGRSLRFELFPFSFQEYLQLKGASTIPQVPFTTREKGQLVGWIQDYLTEGGIPDAVKYPALDIHKTLYDDILHRDIGSRYQIENMRTLKELAFYLLSNITTDISFNRLKNQLKLGSLNTVKKYIGYLENSWLFFVIHKFAYSVKTQQIASKKIYCIDPGLVHQVGFSFSKNQGKLLENLVFLQLRRETDRIFYYQTRAGHEVDFYLPDKNHALQVCLEFTNPETRQRELRSLQEMAVEIDKPLRQTLITLRDKETIQQEDGMIEVLPVYEWLLQPASPLV